MQEWLCASEQRFKLLYDNAPLGYQSLDSEGHIITVNQAWLDLLGYSEKEVIGRWFGHFLTPECQHGFPVRFSQFKTSGKTTAAEFEMIRRDSQHIIVSIDGRITYDRQGNFVQTHCVLYDITNQKQGEKRQQLTRQILQALSEDNASANAIPSILRFIQQFTGFEALGIRLREGEDFPYYATVGFPPEFLEAENYLCAQDQAGELIRDSSGNPVIECMCGNIICGRTDPSLPFFTKGGSFWTNSTTELLASTSAQDRQSRTRDRCNGEGYESVALIPLRFGNKILGLLQLNDSRKDMFTSKMIEFFEELGTTVAIAGARRRTEQALWESERRLREMLGTVKLAVVMLDRGGNIAFVNDFLSDLTGWRQEELLGRNWFDTFIPEQIRSEVKEIHKKSITESITPVAYHENEMLTRTGERRLIAWNNTALRDTGGNIIGTNSIGEDITEHRRAQEALRESAEAIRAIVETSQEWIWATDLAGVHVYCNPAIERILGYTPDELIGRSLSEIVHRDDQDRVEALLARCAAQRVGWTGMVIRWLHKAGEYRYLESNAVPITDSQGNLTGFRGVDRDITDRRLAQQQLQQQQAELAHISRLATLGETVSTVAHELNQPLCAILNFADLCLEISRSGQAPNPQFNDHIETIAAQAERAGKVIEGLRHFAQRKEPSRTMFHIDDVIDETLRLMQYESNQKHILIDHQQNRTADCVSADKIQIQQVLVNLIKNAFEAMQVTDVGHREVAISTEATDNGEVQVNISDTGKGLTDQEREHIFDSFYTTKPEGLGIGLSLSRSIIEAHGGRIWVTSHSPCGVTFSFTLPPRATEAASLISPETR